MSLVNASDLSHSIVKEETFGVTPTAAADRYELPLAADAEPLQASVTQIQSNTKRPNRSSNGSRRGAQMVEGSIETRFVRADFMDLLFQNALCGTYNTDVLKAAEEDQYFSVITKLADDMYKTYSGCCVSGFSLDAKGNEEVSINFDIMGAGQTLAATENALSVTSQSGLTEFVGTEVATITVAGQNLAVAELSFSTSLEKTKRYTLGSDTSLEYGVAGTRECNLMVKAYRESFAVDSAITGEAQECSFQIGGAGTGYEFKLPAAYGDIPKDTLSDGSAFVEINFSCGYDETEDTNLIITRLT
ncbi:phage tail tube protein [Erythrobacteraceae bacterium WH01K]|nr:phage tail tube protein [Erythrobacteraceae bacterium WH01K]